MRSREIPLFFTLIIHLIAFVQSRQQNCIVTRISQPKFKFSLISDPTYNKWTGWTYFPELYRQFTLDKDQIVSITKKVMVIYYPYMPKALVTRVLIDDVIYPLFNGLTGDAYFHDHTVEHSVWLQKGTHTIMVQYNANGMFPTQPGNLANQALYNLLKIVYLSSS